MKGFPGGARCKEHACQCSFRDAGSIPGLERSLVGGHGNPLQYSGRENAMDRGAWWATVHRITKRHDQSGLAQNIIAWLINNTVIVLGNSEGTQPYIYMYPFSPKLPSHPSCHIALSSVPCAIH